MEGAGFGSPPLFSSGNISIRHDKPKGERMVTFVDRVTLHLSAGKGGNGCVSVKREKFKPLAGPDGANGGHGGDIVLVADPQVTTLLSYHHSPHRSAGNGGFGMGDHRAGARGRTSSCPCRSARSSRTSRARPSST